LQVAGASRSWILRFSLAGRRPEMGLGPFPEVTLAKARAAAVAAREQVRQGVNPIEAAKAARSASAAERAASKTFAECWRMFVGVKSPEWSNAKHAWQWGSTFETYVEPIIGQLQVQDVDTPQVLEVLEPIWRTKTETARRVRSRIENVLDFAIARKYREGPNPARWRGHLSHMLAAPGKIAKTEHHAALPYAQVPAFFARLREQAGQGARALELAILCASRSTEVRKATWQEVDLEERVWTIPAERMKGRKVHRVPLSAAAVRLLKSMPRDDASGLIFPSAATGRALSDMTLTAVVRRMSVDAVPHGFRSSFRTWAAEQTTFPRDVVEMALAHTIENEVEAAYQRGDLFDKRRKLMQAWADYCERPRVASVTPIRRGGKSPPP